MEEQISYQAFNNIHNVGLNAGMNDLLKRKSIFDEIGGFDDLDQLYAVACDETETLWVTAFGDPTIKVIAVEPDEILKGRANSGELIGGNTLYLLGYNKKRSEPVPF